MGKEGDLWDDSALIQAFDDAISKYKVMHSKKGQDSPIEGGKVVGSTEGNAFANVNGSHQARRDADEKSNVSSNTALDLGETSNLSTAKESHCVDSCAPEPCTDPWNSVYIQDVEGADKGYSSFRSAQDYNNLVNLYYDLEEKRQKVLEQLHQFGGWNNQYSGEGSGSGVQGGTSAYGEHSIAASQVSHPIALCSCCPYVYQCCLAPCTSCPGCSLGGTFDGKTCNDNSVVMFPGMAGPLEDSNIVKTAMEAAEKAMSSLRTKFSGDSNLNEGHHGFPREREREKTGGETAQSTSSEIGSETDLTVVLNAWYSAGFYTGKYLTEQSSAKKRHS